MIKFDYVLDFKVNIHTSKLKIVKIAEHIYGQDLGKIKSMGAWHCLQP